MKEIPQYCQNCRAVNRLGERICRACGTKLMLVVFPSAIRFDEGAVPSFYEDHLLERVTLLENRLGQLAERLGSTLDLLLRQSKFAQSDHLLLETLIDSLNALGAIEKESLTRNWRQTVTDDDKKDTAEQKNKRILEDILAGHKKSNGELFAHLVKEGIRLLGEKEEKQSFRNFEKALLLSPENIPLAVYVAQTLFLADKLDKAKIYIEKAFELAPENEKILLLLAVVCADQGEAEKAHQLLNKLSRKRVFKFTVHFMSGILASAEENWKEASAAFKELAAVSDTPESHYLAGCAGFQAAKYKQSARHLQKAVEIDLNFADAWFMLALVYHKAGDEIKKNRSVELASRAKEPGAQSLEFLKRKDLKMPETALPFLRLGESKKKLLGNLPMRVQMFFRREIFKLINE